MEASGVWGGAAGFGNRPAGRRAEDDSERVAATVRIPVLFLNPNLALAYRVEVRAETLLE